MASRICQDLCKINRLTKFGPTCKSAPQLLRAWRGFAAGQGCRRPYIAVVGHEGRRKESIESVVAKCCASHIRTASVSLRPFSSARQDGREESSSKSLSTQEDPFDTLTDNIPEKPVSVAEGASYTLVIFAGLALAAAAGYAVFKELVLEPKEYKIYGKALDRIKNDMQVTARLGSPITGYGDESTNRAARQRVRHKVYKDEDGVERIQVQFFVRGPRGAGTVHCEMFYDGELSDWRFTYLLLDVTTPPPKRLMLESYIPK